MSSFESSMILNRRRGVVVVLGFRVYPGPDTLVVFFGAFGGQD